MAHLVTRYLKGLIHRKSLIDGTDLSRATATSCSPSPPRAGTPSPPRPSPVAPRPTSTTYGRASAWSRRASVTLGLRTATTQRVVRFLFGRVGSPATVIHTLYGEWNSPQPPPPKEGEPARRATPPECLRPSSANVLGEGMASPGWPFRRAPPGFVKIRTSGGWRVSAGRVPPRGGGRSRSRWWTSPFPGRAAAALVARLPRRVAGAPPVLSRAARQLRGRGAGRGDGDLSHGAVRPPGAEIVAAVARRLLHAGGHRAQPARQLRGVEGRLLAARTASSVRCWRSAGAISARGRRSSPARDPLLQKFTTTLNAMLETLERDRQQLQALSLQVINAQEASASGSPASYTTRRRRL